MNTRTLFLVVGLGLVGACGSGASSGDDTTAVDGSMTSSDGAMTVDGSRDGATTSDGATTTIDGATTTIDGSTTTIDGSTTTVDGSTTTVDAAVTGTCTPGCATGFSCTAGICKNAAGIPQFDHVYVIMMENHSLSSITNNSAPYLSGLLAANGNAAAYNSVTHPSLPNYIALTSGATQGIDCDCSPTGNSQCVATICNLTPTCNCQKPVMHLGDQLDGVGATWRMYGQGMGAPCNTSDTGNYKLKHIPFAYYSNVYGTTAAAGRCTEHVRDQTDFTKAGGDLATGSYRFMMISPDQCNDMHDSCAPANNAIKQGDDYLKGIVPTIVAKLGARDVLFIVFDEQDNSTGTAPIPFVAMGPLTKHASETGPRDHYSLLRTIEAGFGISTYLGSAAGATPFTQIWK